MYSISTFALNRLNNAEFTGFFVNVQGAINELTADKLGLESTVKTNYDDYLTKLVDQVYTNVGSATTALMQTKDEDRCNIFRRIHYRLMAVDCAETGSPLLSCKETVDTLLLNKYTAKVVSMPYNEKTAILKGFIYDLRDKLTEEDLSNLGITDDVDLLETANNEFITAYNTRSAERAAGNDQLTLKLRDEVYGQYKLMCYNIQYNANSLNTSSTATSDEATAAAAVTTTCQDFIGRLNVMIAEAKSRYQQRLAKTGDTDTDTDEEEGTETKDETVTVTE